MGKFGQWLAETGKGVLSTAANALLGFELGARNDERQIAQQRKLQDMQQQGTMEVMKYGQDLQYDMWQKTGYVGQMEQLRKAGLNPGLLYGMGGAGGATTGGSGGSVGGASAPSGGREAIDLMGMALQRQLMDSQRRNIDADTANKEADTANKGKQGANIEADTELKKMNWNIASIQEKIAGDTQNAVVAKVMSELRTITAQMHRAEKENEIVQATAETAINKAKMDLAVATTENELKKAQKRATEKGIEKADEEIEKIRQEVKNLKDYYDLDNYIEREKVRLMEKGINVAIITSVLGSIMSFATGGRR